MTNFEMLVHNNPEYKKIIAIATRIYMATSSTEISNGVTDLFAVVDNKPMEMKAIAFSITNAGVIAALSETAEEFIQLNPDMVDQLTHMIFSELRKVHTEMDTRGISQRDGFTASYLRDFEDSVRCAESPEAFERAMSKIRPHMDDTTGMGALIIRFLDTGLSEMLVKKAIPVYLKKTPEDKLTGDLFSLWGNLETLLGASAIVPDSFKIKGNE